MVSEDDIKYLVDTLMIEGGFYPVKSQGIFHLDALIMMYKCSNANCKHPYEVIAISGVEHLYNLKYDMTRLIDTRCKIRQKEHKCI